VLGINSCDPFKCIKARLRTDQTTDRHYHSSQLVPSTMTSRNRNIVTASRGDTPRARQSSGDNPRTSRQSSGSTPRTTRQSSGQPRSRSSVRRQGRPRTVEDSNEDAAFIEQLQAWAQETSRKQLTDLESEFERLQSQPRPEPSAEFAR